MRPFLIAGLIFVAACGSRVSELVRIVPEPDGANCPFGGAAIENGRDANGDGVLEDNEVASTSYVCNPSAQVRCTAADIVHTGTLTAHSNADLNVLDGISCLNGDLIISDFDAAQIDPRPKFETVTGNIIIAGNANLTSLDGLGSVTKVGAGYAVEANPSLTSVAALGHLTTFDSISIIDNEQLADLSGMESFQEVPNSSFVIKSNPVMTSVKGLDNVASVQSMTIQDNAALTSVGALGKLRSAALIDISGNPVLPSAQFPTLELVTVRVVLNADNSLASVSLPALTSLGGGLQISNDGALTSIDAPVLIVTGNFVMQTDTSLKKLTAPQLAYATGDLTLNHLPALTQLDLTSLNAIGGSFNLQFVSTLPNLSGFGKVSAIGQDLMLEDCNALTSFQGLGTIKTVPGTLTITANSGLATLDGLTTITQIGGNLTITNNPQLPLSVAQAFAQGVTVTGTVTIH